MKRQLTFNYENEKYIIKEDDKILFSINGKELKFVSLDFYNGVYKDKSAAIKLTNLISADELKKGKYIYEWLNDIIISIQNELNDPEMDDDLIEYENVSSKLVYLFEMSACAGNGFYSDGPSASEEKINTELIQADYAVRISGKSMEPTINDGSTVFVQRVEELHNGEIGIFVVDGNVMCKRLREENGERWLQPDNKTDEYKSIPLTEETTCICQGRVLMPKKS